MTVKISEQRTKEGYEITFFTDHKPLFRKAKILLNELLEQKREDKGCMKGIVDTNRVKTPEEIDSTQHAYNEKMREYVERLENEEKQKKDELKGEKKKK